MTIRGVWAQLVLYLRPNRFLLPKEGISTAPEYPMPGLWMTALKVTSIHVHISVAHSLGKQCRTCGHFDYFDADNCVRM
jgi:hypothetical protein